MENAKRNIYLKTLIIKEAVENVRKELNREALIKSEIIESQNVVGRTNAEAIFAKYSSPTFHSAAMDGIAVTANKTFVAREGHPLVLEYGKDYLPVNTGNTMPDGFDSVIMIEQVVKIDETKVSIENPAFPWQHVRRIGEDIVATELLYPQNHRFSAYDVGVLLSAGIWELKVWEPVKIRIIPTGDEILDFTKRPEPKAGQVIESNSQVLSALAKAQGCIVERIPPVPDTIEAVSKALKESLDAGITLTILCAGSSAGSKDFSRRAIEEHGRVIVHGISAMPGKPALLGLCKDNKGVERLVAGAPGYPVSSIVAYEELMSPLISWLERDFVAERESIDVELTRSIPSKLGVEEFVRLSVGRVNNKFVATPLGRGAGNLTTLSKAHAVTRLPLNSEGAEQGKLVKATLVRPRVELESTLVCVGSHDNILDLLADELMTLDKPIRLASTHVGSMGGLTALKNGSCHFAGTHLFDPETSDFNHSFLKKYLPEKQITLINLALRHQGFIVAKGNQKNIKDIHDLTRNDVKFINRQRGAGTRILLDYHLKQAKIDPKQVLGYDKEEFTHMTVAVNVLTGTADCGLGIKAAATALGLDFIPLAIERYDLAIPSEYLEGATAEPKMLALLDIIRSESFLKRVEALGGYETKLSGQVQVAKTK
ncbi:molybdopterin biosynthesis protein [Desulfovibrio litoralis]|uniref:Molybdopterin molybdenumtransferase n=1 Tax=Desulfovibrio litoralis DSM 11393 TaxID=1121455 RepID=A0A1M7RTP8_9BACT|nr:molybdopterin biosynthesis protein [Desulfovibrio litoralis]SHN49468.1 molybdopterin molybdochelatase [Desulfovibrio litoralis DSM 11393]